MTNGLKVIQLRGRYYSVTLIGWMKRVQGDDWVLLPGYVTAVRTGEAKTLARLASHGPEKRYRISDPSDISEDVHRLVIRRSLRADEAAWKKWCPMPKDWLE